jgi:hypothetical protein
LAAPASARPAYLRSLGEHYGDLLPSSLKNCTTCHLPAAEGKPPTSLENFPHNPFGDRLRRVTEALRTEGKRTEIEVRLRRVAADDSDGDGIANQTELLAGRRPGVATDKPTAPEIAAARKAGVRLAAALAKYRWKPFEPVQRPTVPKPKDAAWATNPIDAFVAVEQESRGLKPRPEVSRELLLRRVSLDLTGLPPTPAERRAFLDDRTPNAYAKVVDRLLATPAYGERWGRHWMDVWRYSDWAGWGEQVRDSLPHVWRWRDWIVESLNENKPYDQMVREMLAGDELAPDDPKTLRATGYLVRNYKLLSREKWMEDVVDYTGQAFMGVTVGCARCHDHMYDPVTQREYFRLRAIFEPHKVRTDWTPGELDLKRDGLPRAYDAELEAKTFLFVRGDERQPVKDDPLKPGIPESLGGALAIQPVNLPMLTRVPEKQPYVVTALRAKAEEQVRAAEAEVAACKTPADLELLQARRTAAVAAQAALEAVLRVEALEDTGKRESEEWKAAAQETVQRQREQAVADTTVKRLEATKALATAESAMPPKPEAVKTAREALTAAETARGKAVEAVSAAVTTAYAPRVTSNYPATSTGRRLAFAKWLTARNHPLAARVAMNQIWLRHFGQAIVPSVADFGRNGVPPTHPQLLDWLATEFMDRGWDMKAMHRLIVTSRAYRSASTPDPVNMAKDPDNRYLWRMNSRRMDAEIVRDSVLYVAGKLDATMGGPDIDQHLGLTVPRRSIYFRHAAEKEMTFTQVFDGPSVVECFLRKETIVPQQALALANSTLTLDQARVLAAKLTEETGGETGRFVAAAFERVLARAATPAELRECIAFLSSQPAPKNQTGAGAVKLTAAKGEDANRPAVDAAQRARENLVLVLMNHHDFVTIR